MMTRPDRHYAGYRYPAEIVDRHLSAVLLFPWFAPARLRALRDDLYAMGGELRSGRIPHADEPRPAAAAFQGLGLVVASVLALTGVVMYFGMAENGAMGSVVHALNEVHEAARPLMWAYLAGHPTIGILHQLAGHRTLSDVPPTVPIMLMIQILAQCLGARPYANRARH